MNKVVEYNFSIGYRVPWLEDILKEFNIETKESWQKIDDEQDWFTSSITFNEPTYPDLYSITYTCLPERDNLKHNFAEILIEDMMQVMSYLEGCLRQEIDNKKEDIP